MFKFINWNYKDVVYVKSEKNNYNQKQNENTLPPNKRKKEKTTLVFRTKFSPHEQSFFKNSQ